MNGSMRVSDSGFRLDLSLSYAMSDLYHRFRYSLQVLFSPFFCPNLDMDTRLLYYLVGALLINIAYGNFDGHVRSHPLDSLHVSSYLNNDFPVHPFTRKLVYSNGSSPLQGKDVYILQNLLKRISSPYTGPINSQYDKATSIAVSELQRQVKLSSTGIFDAATAAALMNPKNGFIFDHHTDDGVTARSYGLKFKVLIVGHYNRSVESQAKLFDEDNNLLHTFIARTHGHSKFGPAPWPEFTYVLLWLSFSGPAFPSPPSLLSITWVFT